MTDKQSRTDAEQAPETGTVKKKKAVPGKKKSPEESAAVTLDNARRFFGI